jgi:hypothetical protein
MSSQIFSTKLYLSVFVLLLSLPVVLVNGCAVSAKNTESSSDESAVETKKSEEAASNLTKNSVPKGRIQITSGSPADTVRIFYKNLRERRFKEAMMMTNLRIAVEGLTDEEMKDLSTDFEPLAAQVPADIEINGEIITNNQATVTAKLPNDDTGAMELKPLKLRREKDEWVMIIAEPEAENAAKKEGKNYFFSLRLDIHHVEAENMMQRIAKAETIYSMQNAGAYADMQTLVSMSYLPTDVQSTESTGYRFTISVETDGKKYFATAEPAVYGRSGKLSFLLESDGAGQQARLKSDDNKGKPLKK